MFTASNVDSSKCIERQGGDMAAELVFLGAHTKKLTLIC